MARFDSHAAKIGIIVTFNLDVIEEISVSEIAKQRACASELANTPPRFNFAKSSENFAPVGSWITTADEVDMISHGIRSGAADWQYQPDNY